MLTGYEQVRSIAAEIAGDHEAARKVELVLPETGVCSGPGPLGAGASGCAVPSSAQAASGCCAPAAVEVKPATTSGCCGPSVKPVEAKPAKSGCC